MQIPITDILALGNPSDYKLHLASTVGESRPLDVWLEDREEWVGWNQHRGAKNDWNLPRVLGLIDFYPQSDTWLFGGVFEVMARKKHGYDLMACSEFRKWEGRLLIHFHRTRGMRGRSFRLDRYLEELSVGSVLGSPYSGEAFPGVQWIEHDFDELARIWERDAADWKAALTDAQGVYVITDKKSGKKYVGAAYGEGGLWGRWGAYLSNGHGGNKVLRDLARDHGGIEYARKHYRFSVIEQFPPAISERLVREREAHWKRALLSRELGNNAN